MNSFNPHPAITVVGVGSAGGQLLSALTAEHGPNNLEFLAVNGFHPFDETHCRGADVVLILAGVGEEEARYLTKSVAAAACRARALVIAMMTPCGMAWLRPETLDADCGNGLYTKILLPSSSATRKGATIAAYIAATIDGLVGGFQLTAPVAADFHDCRTVLDPNGKGHIGVGYAKAMDRGRLAAAAAIQDLGHLRTRQASGILILVAGSTSMRLREITAVANLVYEWTPADCNTCMAAHYDRGLGSVLRVTLIVVERRSNGV
jgi:cell division GTPase FtsZ